MKKSTERSNIVQARARARSREREREGEEREMRFKSAEIHKQGRIMIFLSMTPATGFVKIYISLTLRATIVV